MPKTKTRLKEVRKKEKPKIPEMEKPEPVKAEGEVRISPEMMQAMLKYTKKMSWLTGYPRSRFVDEAVDWYEDYLAAVADVRIKKREKVKQKLMEVI